MLNRETRTRKESRLKGQQITPLTLVRRRLPTSTKVFDTYWRFAFERQEILLRRVQGASPPWTADPIFAKYKFTNAYRAADRVSQYLIRNVIYAGAHDARDTVFRILLFKLFNKIETWQLLEQVHGELVVETFDVERLSSTLSAALAAGTTIYSGAYIMPSGPADLRQPRKHRMHLELLDRALRDNLPSKLVAAPSLSAVYSLLRELPTIGPFLAYQFATDLNYSGYFRYSEMEFVVPGPGARDGMRKCFRDLGDYSEADVIRWTTEQQTDAFEARGLVFRSLWGRALQLIDCQNLFCEVDKYARVMHPDVSGYSGRTRIKQKFSPRVTPLHMWFPPKWGINEAAEADQLATGTALL